MKKIAIFSTEYSDNSGGIIVMHYLCHLLRGLGVEAYMFPRFGNFFINFALNNNEDYVNYLGENFAKSLEIFGQKKYRTNPIFDTPVIFETPSGGFNENWIVIYPENTLGNPLMAKNIVRWLLAPPMQHQEIFSVSQGEFLVKHGKVGIIKINGTHTSEMDFSIQYTMDDIYYQFNTSKERIGTAYSIRKGKNKKIVHDLNNSICIDDGFSHREIAEIFNNIQTFVSYDSATFYSQYAVFCGSNSVVIPDQTFTLDEWRKMPNKKGIAYGFEEMEWARNTKHLLFEYYRQRNIENVKQCREFIGNLQRYFL